MVGTGKQKLCPTGDRAELADDKPVTVDGVVVQHIVLFKLGGVVDKVVIPRIVADDDAGSGDLAVQVYRLGVAGTRLG